MNNSLPAFSQLNPEHIEEQLTALLERNRQKIAGLTQQPHFTWETLVEPLEAMDNELSLFWAPIGHLHAVQNTPEWRKAYEVCQPKLTDYATELSQNEALYQAFNALAESPAYHALNTAQKKVIANHLRDFKLSGIALSSEKKQRYAELQRRLTELSTQFENNIIDATDNWSLHITESSRVAGLPERALSSAHTAAAQRGLSGWLFTLEFPSYYAVMTYADDRALREEMYSAYVTRASDQGPDAGKWDNSAIMDELLKLRHELAQLLDFNNYAELSLATKMAKEPAKVIAFLTELAQKAKPKAIAELAELRTFAATLGIADLAAWDLSYCSEKLQQQRYDISEEELRPYFPETKVLQGMFTIVQRLYGISIQEKAGIDIWHPDVKFFEIYNQQQQLLGQFYVDLYARAQKRGGAWMDDYSSRWRNAAGQLQTPIAFLTCNFAGPIDGKPALFNHEEVLTLFHEFGHGLHHMLTQIDYLDVSGINGVAWDAVELPSQLMENWCWDYEALQLVSSHYLTGEPLPKALFEKMHAAKNFQAALRLVRQLEFGLFDFKLHYEYNSGQPQTVQTVLDEVRAQVSAFKPPAFNRFQHSFSHIFAGGYAAGYYSYLWADVLASDAFSRFEAEGIFNPKTGQDFLNAILSQGGSREPLELFVEFKGREPTIDALLKQYALD